MMRLIVRWMIILLMLPGLGIIFGLWAAAGLLTAILEWSHGDDSFATAVRDNTADMRREWRTYWWR